MKYWLMKTEPNTYSFQNLKAEENQTTNWEGVRNYQARNFMKDMKKGDLVFFYHSVVQPVSIVGIAKVVKEAYPDFTQFDTSSKYYFAKSTKEDPKWFMVDVQYYKEFETPVTLTELKEIPELENMYLVQKGSRLSVQPVTKNEWDIITKLRKFK